MLPHSTLFFVSFFSETDGMGLHFCISWEFSTQYGKGNQIKHNLTLVIHFSLIVTLQQVSTPSFQYPSLSQGQLNESQMDSRSLRLDRIQQALAMTSDEMRR